MATGLRIYKSTDASAPVLTGQTGSLTALLDACLVNGYGAKSAAGSSPGAGAWTIAFTGTSKRVYRAASGNRFYLRVQDDGPGAGTFKEARLFAYETIADVDAATNTGPFPTTTQKSTGMFVRKSLTADATARSWIVAADDRTVYVFINSGDGYYTTLAFGDYFSLLTGDGYRSIIVGRVVENTGTGTAGVDQLDISAATTSPTSAGSTPGHYIPRSYLGTGGSINVLKVQDPGKGISNSFGTSGIPYPNPPDQSIYLSPNWLFECGSGTTTTCTGNLRGYLRGLYAWGHAVTGAADGDTFSGSGLYAGKTFLVIKPSANSGIFALETSDTWDTSS